MATHAGWTLSRHLTLSVVIATLAYGCVNSSTYSSLDFDGSQFYVSNTSVVADGQTSAVVGLAVKKADGTASPGLSVTFYAANCNITQPSAPTNGDGLVRASISSSHAGLRTVTATIVWADLNKTLNKMIALNFVADQAASGLTPNQPQDAVFTVIDANGGLDANYTGTVRFTATDPLATLPPNYTYTRADGGKHAFSSGLTLRTAGMQIVSAVEIHLTEEAGDPARRRGHYYERRYGPAV